MTQVQRNIHAPLWSYIPVKCVHLYAYLKYKLRFGKFGAVVTENEKFDFLRVLLKDQGWWWNIEVRKRKLKIVRPKKDIELGLFHYSLNILFGTNLSLISTWVVNTVRTYRNIFRTSTRFCPVLIKILMCERNLVQLPNIKFWGYS